MSKTKKLQFSYVVPAHYVHRTAADNPYNITAHKNNIMPLMWLNCCCYETPTCHKGLEDSDMCIKVIAFSLPHTGTVDNTYYTADNAHLQLYCVENNSDKMTNNVGDRRANTNIQHGCLNAWIIHCWLFILRYNRETNHSQVREKRAADE